MPASLSNSFIDTHFHVFDAGQGTDGARYVPAYDASLAMWQSCSAPVGIGRGVLVQTSFMGTDNRRLVQELQSRPGLLRGVVVVPPDVAAEELRWLHAQGVRGIRLNLAGRSHAPDRWHPSALWDTLAELGWHVELHTDIDALPEVLAWMPAGLTTVLDHMGRPKTASAADRSLQAAVRRARHSPVHVKLSGAYRLNGCDARVLARIWQSELGIHRLVWGSDWPCTNHESEADYPQLLRCVHDWVDASQVQQVLVHNPAQLYDFAQPLT